MPKRKIKLLIIYSLCICLMQVNSSAWGNSTDQQKIDSAISIIRKYGFEKNVAVLQGNNYTHKPVKIVFKDLTELDFSYSKHYAISATDNNGDLYILINSNLRNSDTMCLACLILHESFHATQEADSLFQEVKAHFAEVTLYNTILINEDENLQNNVSDRLVARENHLKELVETPIKSYISNNTTYINYLKIKE